MNIARRTLIVGAIVASVCFVSEAMGSITAKRQTTTTVSGVQIVDYEGSVTLKLSKPNTERAVYAHAAKIRFNPKQKSYLISSPASIHLNHFVFTQAQPGTTLLVSADGEMMKDNGRGKWNATLTSSLATF